MLFLSHPRNDPLRASIVVMAITASLTLVIVLSSLSVGVRESSRESLERVGADLYVVPEDLHPLLMDLQRFDQGWYVQRELERSEFAPSAISPRLSDALFYETDHDIGEVIAFGVVPGMESDFHQFRLVEGHWFGEQDDPLRDGYIQDRKVDQGLITYEVMLSLDFSRSIGIGVGDEISISPSLLNGTTYSFKVEGIFFDSLSRLSRSIMVHLGELQLLKGHLENDTLTEMLLAYNDGTDPQAVKEWAESSEFDYRDIVDVVPSEEVLVEVYKFLGIIDGFAAMVIGVTLFICLVFTSVIFMISAKERSRDTAVLRAIGISALRIFQWVVMESSLFYLVGTIGGLLLGMISIWALNIALSDRFPLLPEGFIPFRLDITVVLFTIGVSFILAILSALIPAFRTASRPPMESLRGDVS